MPPPRSLARAASFRPPQDWRVVHQRLEAYRRSLRDLPPDVALARSRHLSVDNETRRFHCLVRLMLSSMTHGSASTAAVTQLMDHELTPSSVQRMGEAGLKKHISCVNFHHRKAAHISQVADILLREYGGKVPREYNQLLALPGVGPKVANLFFLVADDRVVGIGVDTHVHRVSQRLGWVPKTVKSPEDTRKALESWLPREHWANVHFTLVTLGKRVCAAQSPQCAVCVAKDSCPSAFQVQRK
ncbi:HhH-GPD superfamily base excision DNA repair protein [Novymonas esmeraldas]|uniref:HhH-GPD superfamily base excision DNA repair protein n=1 Tax=Novymonas esmeraldas TaxID=1808958 RepID=A0AAW0ES61_9TRYP